MSTAIPQPLAQPVAVPFPAELPARAPGVRAVLHHLGATLMECGATNADNAGLLRLNQCLYLSLAAATAQRGHDVHPRAASMRQHIEAAVRQARPSWAAQDFLGQEVGAFADFLTWGLQATPPLRGQAVAVYDGRTGTCEIFRPLRGPSAQPPRVIGLWFTGGHYRWLRWRPPGPNLPQLLAYHRRPPTGAPRVITVITTAED